MSKQISELEETNTLNDESVMPVVHQEETKKISFSNLKRLLSQIFIVNESDPTVPSWAKASHKPGYTFDEIANKPDSYTPSEHTHNASDIPELENVPETIGIDEDTYDSTSTYTIGSIVVYQNKIYKCITAVEEAEEFDNTKWIEISIRELINDLNEIKANINDTIIILEEEEIEDDEE